MDDSEVESLVEAAAGGDEAAWQRLWIAIEPPLTAIVGRGSFLGRLSVREDERREIVVRTMARVRADQFQRLQQYLEARRHNPQLKFLSWLRVVAKRVGIDYMRAHPDYVRRHEADASRPGEWIDPDPLPPPSQGAGQRPPMTNLGTAHQLLEHARGALPEEQVKAIELWSHNESFADIAKQLDLASDKAAEKLVRAALERLRRKFRDATDGAT